MMSRLKNINIAVWFNFKVIQKVFTIVRIIVYNYNGLFPVRDKFRYTEKLEMTFDFFGRIVFTYIPFFTYTEYYSYPHVNYYNNSWFLLKKYFT